MSRPVNTKFRNTLRGASKMIQAGRLMELTTAIQRSLSGDDPAATVKQTVRRSANNVIDVVARVMESTAPGMRGTPRPTPRTEPRTNANPAAGVRTAQAGSQVDGEFVAGSFSNQAGTRAYKLYVPSGAGTKPLPLVVMLHGCSQSPDDFAAGTLANEVAEELHCFVLYPAQANNANMQKCWNWFQPGDQQRGQGEPSMIAEMTRDVMRTRSIDEKRVYVAGLSAGGAMAVTMATTYPELFAAAGVHSGLPHGAAHDMISAFSAMRQGPHSNVSTGTAFVPTIVFHGDRDTTVHPCNGEQVIAQSHTLAPAALLGKAHSAPPPVVELGQVAAGHAYTRTTYSDHNGQALTEHWVIHGAGHAWSGGSNAGSYTDPHGPDATREMFRFFLAHPQRARH